MTDEELRFMYGNNIVVSRKDRFALVHLDAPTEDLVARRTAEFDPDTFFVCGCKVCQLTKKGGVVIFDDTDFDNESLEA